MSSSSFPEGFAEVCAGSCDGAVPAAPVQLLGLLQMFDCENTCVSHLWKWGRVEIVI